MSTSARQCTLQELFYRAIQIENKAEEIYRELEKRFAHDREAAAFWRSLAEDERAHAEVLANVMEEASPEKLESLAPDEVWIEVTHILHFMDRDLLRPIKSLRDAWELAHQLEYSEVNAVFEFLSVDALPGVVEREFVHTHIAMHQKKLNDFMINYKGDWRAVPVGSDR